MTKLIKNGRVAPDEWKTLALPEGAAASRVRLPVGPVLVPLSVWKARRYELIQREYEHGWPLGVWLAAGESAEAIVHDVDDFSVIAIELNPADESNGLTNARLLRHRYGYRAELRATGAVSRDRLARLHQLGFDAFAVTDAGSDDKSLWAGLSELFGLDSAAAPAHAAAAAA